MKYTHRVQVLFTEKQYKTLQQIASKEHTKLGILVRKAVEEVYLKEEKKRRIKEAVNSLLKMAKTSDIPSPEDWHKWEKEYGKLKSGCEK